MLAPPQTVVSCNSYHLPSAEMTEIGNNNATTSIYIYNGVGLVPSTATQVRVVDLFITKIPSFAFCFHVQLMTVELPEGLEKIRSHTFAYCLNLEMINIPSTLCVI